MNTVVKEINKDRKLGKNQVAFLDTLKSHRNVWHPDSQWSWKAKSETVRMLEPLERRGYVARGEDGKWRMTPEGRAALRAAQKPANAA